ncbi:hypothetical protein HDA40_007975 [Hamadaea flava]|uniref:Uncharacterized protein n=1 Tax=Hamadaea flava TaxID=1742688 RepID=A0ABV8LDW6_9ACTN|nr:hypothetical protein [Hamadaea flava]MCP2329468.1 hypothetical protein [Hamadaea flava]
MFADPPHDDHPTLVDTARSGRGRHAVDPPAIRRLLPLLAAGTVIVVLGVVLGLQLSAGTPQHRPEGFTPIASTSAVADPPATASPETSAPAPSPTPAKSSSTRVATSRAVQLTSALRTTIRQLDHAGQLDSDAARSLDRLVRDARRALSGGDLEPGRDRLRVIGETVGRLRSDGELSAAGYATLTKALAQIEDSLTRP